MAALRGSERKYLRGLAHGMRPVVQIGKEGVTEQVLVAIGVALDARELIKVQFLASREQKRELAASIEQRVAAECVGIIGHIAIFYRQQPDPDRRSIHLPA
jgi:RNA-binding protein